MRLLDVLSVLSKSSPYAVSTERQDSISNELDEIKKYLFIETELQKDFYTELTKLSIGSKKLIFLCGSSGDGKSELLTKYAGQFSHKAHFHLDATHSFEPNGTAITTLDQLFSDYDTGSQSLVVGINVGMLGNYAMEGSNSEICNIIAAYLEGEKDLPEEYKFFNFEDYPKFRLTSTGHESEFVSAVLKRITQPENNIIRQYYDKELAQSNCNKVLCTNYKLLSIPEVQDRIIDTLFKARLIKEQFLTARTLLDFIHNLLSPKGYIFDNLFDSSDNEVSQKIVEFNPANIRTETVDKFILGLSLGLKDSEFDDFSASLSNFADISNMSNPYSCLKLFYLLGNANVGNNYHHKFSNDFDEPLLYSYAKIWNLHANYDGDINDKKALRAFYKDTIFASIHAYINRNAKSLGKGKYLVSQQGKYQIFSEIELEPNFQAIHKSHETSASIFHAYIAVDGKPIKVPVNINLLSMMMRIINGYRPNKHDKNTVVILDEIAEHIAEIASQKDRLSIIKGNLAIEIKYDEDEIVVSGI